MIVTLSTLVVFQTIIGTWQLQASMFLFALFMYTYPDYEITDISDGSNQNGVVFSGLIICTLNHFYLGLVMFIFNHMENPPDFPQASLQTLGLLSQLFCLVKSGEVVYRVRWQSVYGEVNKDSIAIGVFFLAEMLVFTNIVLSNIAFMLMRAIWKHKVLPEQFIKPHRRLKTIDTLIALRHLSDQFTNQFVPFVTTIMLYYESLFGVMPDQSILQVYKFIISAGTFSFIDLWLQLFISWKKGPVCWTKTAPYIYFINLHMTYIVWPGIIISIISYGFIANWDVFFHSPYSGWTITFYFLQMLWLAHYFFNIRTGQLRDAMKYIKLVKKSQDNYESAKPHEKLAIAIARCVLMNQLEGNQMSYLKQSRKYGEGVHRLGTSIELGEDIYCLAFVCFLQDDLLNKHICVETDLLQSEKDTKRQQELETLQALEVDDPSYADGEQSLKFYESNAQRRQYILINKRTNIMIQAILTFLSQMILVALIIYTILQDYEQYFEFMPLEYQEFVRFICTLMLHLFLLGELRGALARMKFVLNHDYLFESPNYAFANTLLQATALVSVEFCSLLVILSTTAPEDTVMNFIALAIIAAFDDYVFSSTKNEILKKLLSDDIVDQLCIIRHTTSKRAKSWEQCLEKYEDEEEARKLKLTFKDRTCANKTKWGCYKLWRMFYVSAYFYFEPFFVVLMSVWLPMFMQTPKPKV